MKKNIFLALLLVPVLILCGCAGEKKEAYRIIQVLEVSGSVSVERESLGTVDAYEGMRLESGDRITVGGDSWLKMKMDEDKYALVEPDSVLRLEASGSSADSFSAYMMPSAPSPIRHTFLISITHNPTFQLICLLYHRQEMSAILILHQTP